jgi:hypothetical protein
VDFGSFQDALTQGSESKEITIGIDFSLDPIETRTRTRIQAFSAIDSFDYSPYAPAASLLRERLNGTVLLHLREGSQGTYASHIEIQAFGSTCQVDFMDSGRVAEVQVNKVRFWVSEGDSRGIGRQTGFLPKLVFVKRTKSKIGDETRNLWRSDNPLIVHLLNEIGRHVHGNTSRNKILAIAKQTGLAEDAILLKALRNINSAPRSWIDALASLSPGRSEFISLRNAIFAYRLPMLIEAIDLAITSFFSNVRYLEPLRATTQRYYRRQELAIDEIDSKGANVAMYLDSLSNTDASLFRQWMLENFGVSVSAVKEGGHIALKLKESGSNLDINLADMGFGFSQVLPIAVQLWAIGRIRANQRTKGELSIRTIVIEQPELHLHPQFQAKLADIIAAAVKSADENNVCLNVILETHSSHLVSRIGELISVNEFAADKAAVILFNQIELNRTIMKTSTFDDDGVLIDWPFGFFEPDS